MIRLLLALACLALPAAAQAQTVTLSSPITLNAAGQPRAVTDVFIRNLDGTIATISGAGVGVPPNATPAAGATLVLKASAGLLYGLNVTAGATPGYVMVFNASAAPADGTVSPAKCIPLAANTGIDLNYRSAPASYTIGVVVVFSSTGCFTKTASATAFISGEVK